MKPAGHRLGQRLGRRIAAVSDRFARARYFRGHGVHSPFVYALVREVFMRTDLLPGDRTLYETLRAGGIAQRQAVQLQNLAIHAGYDTFGVNRADAEFCIVSVGLPQSELPALIRDASERGATVAIMTPYADHERQTLCRKIVAAHGSTSVDNRAYLLLFNNYLPKQHFRL